LFCFRIQDIVSILLSYPQQLTLLQTQHHIRPFRQLIGVRHDHQTLAGFMGAFFQNGGNLGGSILVQITGRFVRKDDLGIAAFSIGVK